MMNVCERKRRRPPVDVPYLCSGSHDRAVLLYEYVGKKTVDLQHTEVPDAYRGRGIAKHLAKVAGLGRGVPELKTFKSLADGPFERRVESIDFRFTFLTNQ